MPGVGGHHRMHRWWTPGALPLSLGLQAPGRTLHTPAQPPALGPHALPALPPMCRGRPGAQLRPDNRALVVII